MEKLFYPLLCIRQNPPRQPTTFTLLAAAAAAAATTAATASHCHSRRSPFFGALNYRPELQNSGLERVVCTRVYAGKWNTVSYDPGWAGGARREDGRKFATSSLMLLKQKTPASTEPVRVASRATPLSRRGVGPSFLPSFLPPFVSRILSLLSLQHLRKTSDVFESRPLPSCPHSPCRVLLSCISLVL